jgi:hypothetical protein
MSDPALRALGPKLLSAAFALAVLSVAAPAAANPRPLPFTYPHEQLVEGATELEQFIDFTPVKARDGTTADPTGYGSFQFQTEFEHGLTDRLELGLYVFYAPTSSSFTDVPRPFQGNGMKQRLRYKLADTGAWPIDVSLYGELVESDTEFEIEAKLILQRRFGLARIMANMTAEQEFEYEGDKDLVISPSAGATFEITPAIQPGFEWWMRAEYKEEDAPAVRPFAFGPHQYIGPVVMLQFGPLWWTNGFYLRVSDFNRPLSPSPVDAIAYGHFWMRSVIGYGF